MLVIKNQSSKVVVCNEHNIDDDYGHHVCACTMYTRTVALTATEHSVHISLSALQVIGLLVQYTVDSLLLDTPSNGLLPNYVTLLHVPNEVSIYVMQ